MTATSADINGCSTNTGSIMDDTLDATTDNAAGCGNGRRTRAHCLLYEPLFDHADMLGGTTDI